MGSYRLLIGRSVAKDLDGLPKPALQRVLAAIAALADDPRPQGCKRLVADDRWRIRVGDYRVLYRIHDQEVLVVVVAVAHRSTAYRGA